MTPVKVQHTLFGALAPTGLDVTDEASYELGVVVHALAAGEVTHVRFYCHPIGELEWPIHVHVWNITGALVGEGVATGPKPSVDGWVQVALTEPVPVLAGVKFVVSYFKKGVGTGYFHTSEYWDHNEPLVPEVMEALDIDENGRFNAEASAFPASTFNAGNYWVDLVFVTEEEGPPAPEFDDARLGWDTTTDGYQINEGAFA